MIGWVASAGLLIERQLASMLVRSGSSSWAASMGVQMRVCGSMAAGGRWVVGGRNEHTFSSVERWDASDCSFVFFW